MSRMLILSPTFILAKSSDVSKRTFERENGYRHHFHKFIFLKGLDFPLRISYNNFCCSIYMCARGPMDMT